MSEPSESKHDFSSSATDRPRSATYGRKLLFRAFSLGAIILLLAFGLSRISGVLNERDRMRAVAVGEIRDSWGPDQTVIGPILRVPYETVEAVPHHWMENGRRYETIREERTRRSLWLAPHTLESSFRVATESRYRGIYEAIVYAGTAQLEADFVWTSDESLEDATILWEEAELILSLQNGSSLRSRPEISSEGKPFTVRPRPSIEGWQGAIGCRFPLSLDQISGEVAVAVNLELQGTGAFMVAPIGDTSTLTIEGDWPHPSFQGSPLPVGREVTESGFTSRWQTTEFARGFASPFFETETNKLQQKTLKERSVGVALLQPVDAYRVTERALKYGMLFIVLVFAAFLLFEVLGTTPLHPVQYLLVGSALVLFFLGFLSLSEVVSITLAYLLSATACVALISVYAKSVLRAGRKAWLIAAGLSGIYGYLYFVLRSESYALLSGTILLFGALATIMLATRRIDWASPIARKQSLDERVPLSDLI